MKTLSKIRHFRIFEYITFAHIFELASSHVVLELKESVKSSLFYYSDFFATFLFLIIFQTVYKINIRIMKKKEALTQKQKMFCLEYLKSFNATAAYKKVYWVSQKSAEALWPKLLGNVRVSEYLAEKTQQKTEKLDVWVDFVLQNLREIVEIWMGKKEVFVKGKDQTILDLANVNSALEKLWKYNKMYTDKVENDTSIQFKIVSFKKWEK